MSKETEEKYQKMSTSELTRRFDEASGNLDERRAQYSDEEIDKVLSAYRNGDENVQLSAYTPESAREQLFINDLMQQKQTGEELEKRKKEG